jgi:hypothetical protein
MSPTKAGTAFAAWHAIEYAEPITDVDIDMAWRDVELALQNLCAMTELWDLLWAASRCIVQRPLQFESFRVKVKAIPDLIAFYADAPPLIIDWKVHTRGSYGSRSQLALYALALARCRPHRDFPSPSRIGDPTELRLLEVQLLTGQQRFYRLCDEDRAAPAPLCYPVVDLDCVRGKHRLTMPAPHRRYGLTRQYARHYLQNLRLGDTRIEVDLHPLRVRRCTITVPDLRFGHGQVLSVRGTPGARQINLAKLGEARLAMLRDERAGFYVNTPLDRQYIIIPRSICDSMGDPFLNGLKATTDSLFPQPGGYCPTVIPWNDHGKKSFVRQAHAVFEAVASFCVQPGYGVVMLHRTNDRAHRQEDQLAAAVVRELFERHQLRVGVIHCDTVRECYREVLQSDGQRRYYPDPSQRGRLSGYLRNVALNKILLINHKWPFVLADRLHADITIGIDVKNNTCGLLAVGRFGADIRPFLKTSRQQEQLQSLQIKKYLCEVLRDEASATSEPIRTIVIHRDGTLWPTELEGLQQAIVELKREGVIPLEATLTVLEIPKSSPVPLRLYDVTEGPNSRSWIENAEVGDCYIVDDTEAYLCTTGQPFLRQGTARPLHVKRVAGPLPFALLGRSLRADRACLDAARGLYSRPAHPQTQ